MKYLTIIIAIVSEVAATYALKYTKGFSNFYPTILAIVGYICSFYFLAISLKWIRIDIAYAIWSGAGIILISILNTIIEQKIPNIAIIFGQVFIAIGIIVIHLNTRK